MKIGLLKKIKYKFQSFPGQTLWNKIRWEIAQGLSNFWKFRNEIYNFRSWDYTHNLVLFKRSLELTLKCIENGNGIETTRKNKVRKIKRCIEILSKIINDDFMPDAEKSLGYKYKYGSFDFIKTGEKDKNGKPFYTIENNLDEKHQENNKKLSKEEDKIHQQSWEELWNIIEGNQSIINYKENMYDGSDMRSWWN